MIALTLLALVAGIALLLARQERRERRACESDPARGWRREDLTLSPWGVEVVNAGGGELQDQRARREGW